MAIKTIEILNVMVFKRHLRKNNAAFKSLEEGDSLMVEYKNACLASAKNPQVFYPMEDKKISIITRKFNDSLHYLRLLDKNKPVWYIYGMCRKMQLMS